jgi:IPT/TIG domain-containing protein
MTRLVPALQLVGLTLALGLCLTACEESKTLTVTGLEPTKGKYLGGDRVHILGTGFSTQGFTVYFGKKKASNCLRESPTGLVCDSPAGTKDEQVDVQVIFDDSKEATLKKAFKYIDPIGEGQPQVPTVPAPGSKPAQ